MKQPVILFDGFCNFCNGTINFIIDNDPKGVFRFSSLQSDFGQRILRENKLPASNFDTIYLLEEGFIYKKSDAAIEIMKHLKWLWPLSYVLRIFPRTFRDNVYDFIAANRYRIFGKTNTCRIPADSVRNRFINR